MIDLCFKHKIYPDIHVIEAREIDMAWKKLSEGKNDDGIRFVIAIKKSLLNKEFIVHEYIQLCSVKSTQMDPLRPSTAPNGPTASDAGF